MHPNNLLMLQELRDWFAGLSVTDVTMVENPNPDNDPYPDYEVEHEVVFDPVSLDKCRIEIWLTEGGYIGLGLDSWAKIAARAGLRGAMHRFGGGFEPGERDRAWILEICRAVSAGNAVLSFWSFAGRLQATRVHVPRQMAHFHAPIIKASFLPLWLIPLVPTGRQGQLRYSAWTE